MSTQTLTAEMKRPKVVSPQEWEAARQQLLVKEKELTRARDALAAERRRMPWLAVKKEYKFDGPEGKVSLLDLFDGRRQLIVYRAFFEPGVHGWPEHACIGCSMVADQVAHPAHLNARDTTLVFVSRAPQKDIERLKTRMGWGFIPWYTLTDDFDKDFGVDEWHGTNAFIRDGDDVFRTYFINKRGDEQMGALGTTSTSQPSGARRSGRIRRRVTHGPRHTSGGSGTTNSATCRHLRGGAPLSTAEFRLGKDGDGAARDRSPLFDCLKRCAVSLRRANPHSHSLRTGLTRINHTDSKTIENNVG